MNLQLNVKKLPSRNGEVYQCLEIVTSGTIEPLELPQITLPDLLDFSQGIIFWGAAPIWLVSHLVYRCAEAPWVGCYDLQSGSVVVVASRSPELPAQDYFRLVRDQPAANALFIGGPPNSGKSVLSYALLQALKGALQDKTVHLHRAQWDGEGNWSMEAGDRELVDELRQRSKAAWSDRFFLHHSNAVCNIREAVDLVLVDFGGKPKHRDLTLLHRCTHYLIISSNPEAIPEWHNFCSKYGGLTPVAVIHSVLDSRVEVLRTEPFLEIVAGPWHRNQRPSIPDVLLARVMQLISD